MVTRETSLYRALAQMGIQASDQAIRRLALLADLLENDAVDLGFLGPNEGQRVVSRHLLESAALVPHLPPEDPIVDVGSGAGLPGLVLGALGRRMILIESQAKRVRFLREAASALDMDVDVRHARAEDEGRGDLREAVGGVVARALATPVVALELCLPLVHVGGRVFLAATPEGSPASAGGAERSLEEHGSREDREPRASRRSDSMRGGSEDSEARDMDEGSPAGRGAARRIEATRPAAGHPLVGVAEMLGGGDVRWEELPVPGADGPRWVMIVDKRRPTPDRFPRRPGVPKRRPLGGDVASVN